MLDQSGLEMIKHKLIYLKNAALTLVPCFAQCPVSLRRMCEPSRWHRTRRWSHGQSLHGWRCTVCWKATGLCFGPSSLTEVGAVGARPSGQCRVIITYLILNFTKTHPPTHLLLRQCCKSVCVNLCQHLSHKALPVPMYLWISLFALVSLCKA